MTKVGGRVEAEVFRCHCGLHQVKRRQRPCFYGPFPNLLAWTLPVCYTATSVNKRNGLAHSNTPGAINAPACCDCCATCPAPEAGEREWSIQRRIKVYSLSIRSQALISAHSPHTTKHSGDSVPSEVRIATPSTTEPLPRRSPSPCLHPMLDPPGAHRRNSPAPAPASASVHASVSPPGLPSMERPSPSSAPSAINLPLPTVHRVLSSHVLPPPSSRTLELNKSSHGRRRREVLVFVFPLIFALIPVVLLFFSSPSAIRFEATTHIPPIICFLLIPLYHIYLFAFRSRGKASLPFFGNIRGTEGKEGKGGKERIEGKRYGFINGLPGCGSLGTLTN